MAKDYLDVEATEPLANGDGLNVLIKREVVGFRANTVEKTGHNRYRVWPNDMPADLHKVRPHHPLNRNLDHNWQQALTKPPVSAVWRLISCWAAGRNSLF
ncbi:collagenase [Salmonella enterica subsp. enterica serovar Typhimurium]|nr:collagenase [Salmonella enterica subsp. enterica serovar Typhimurium]